MGWFTGKLKSRHNCQSNTTSYKEQDLSPEVYHILVQVSSGRDNTAICSCKYHSASNTQIWRFFVLGWVFVFKKWYEVKLQTTRTLLTHGYLGKWAVGPNVLFRLSILVLYCVSYNQVAPNPSSWNQGPGGRSSPLLKPLNRRPLEKKRSFFSNMILLWLFS